MKNILLPTDFSKNSLNAIEYAMKFFKNWSCNFYILNVQETSEYITDDLILAPATESVYNGIASDNKKKLEKLIGKYKKQFQKEDYSFEVLFDFDSFIDAIQQTIASRKIDLIIMGTNGATGAREVVFGSNTMKVIRNIKCPILAIPHFCQYKCIQNILFSTYRCDDFSSSGILPLKDLMIMHEPILSVLEIDDDAIVYTRKQNDDRIKNLFREVDYKYYQINGIPQSIAINSFVQLMEVDIHALFVEHESFLERFIFGSESTQISYGSFVPLLILHR